MSRETFSKTDSYHVEWEDHVGIFHVHCEVSLWSASVLKQLYVEFEKLKIFAKGLGYGKMASNTPNPKFCELFLAVPYGSVKEGYEVMVWELD